VSDILKDKIKSDADRFNRELNNPPPVAFEYGDGSGERRVIHIPREEYETLVQTDTSQPLVDVFPSGMWASFRGDEVEAVWAEKREAGMPEGFEECDQCRCWHRPVTGVCGFKLEKDAVFVLDASGATLSPHMIERVLRELDIKESFRFVSTPEQQEAYLDAGNTFGLPAWMVRTDYPPDVVLVETLDECGLIKGLASARAVKEGV